MFQNKTLLQPISMVNSPPKKPFELIDAARKPEWSICHINH